MLISTFTVRNGLARKRAQILGTTILVSALAGPVMGQSTLTWNGGTGTWDTTTNNWNPGPTTFTFGDSAIFPNASDVVTVDNGGAGVETISVNDITFTATGIQLVGPDRLAIAGTVTVGAGLAATQLVEVTGDLTKDGGGQYLVRSGGTVTGITTVDDGSLLIGTGGSLGGRLELNGGSAQVLAGSSVAGTSNVRNGTSLTVDDGTVQNVNVSPSGTFVLGASGDVQGTFDSDAAFTFSTGTMSGDVENSGTFTIVGDRTVGGDFTNETGGILTDGGAGGDESLTVDGGDFLNAGQIQSAGGVLTIDADRSILQSGTTINGANDLDGTVVFTGELTTQTPLDVTADMTLGGRLEVFSTLGVDAEIDAGGFTIENNGTLTLNPTGSVANGGVLDNNSDMTIADGATATFTDVSNAGSGTSLDVNGELSGTVENASNATLTVSSTGQVIGDINNSNGATLTLNGTGVEDADGDIDGAVANAAATFDLTDGSVGTVSNSAGGAFTSDGTSTIDTTLTNSGTGSTTEIATGTLDVQGDVTTNEDSAEMTVASGAVLESASVINRSDATLTVDGDIDGAVANSAATFNLNAGSVGEVDNSAGGSFTSNGSSTIDTNLTNSGAGSTTEIATGALNVQGVVTTNEDSAEMTVSSGAVLESALVNNRSGATLTVEGLVVGEINNRAILNLDGAVLDGVENGRATDFGTVNVRAGGATAEVFNNSGVVEFDGGTLTVNVSPGERVTNRENGVINLDSGVLDADNLNNNAGAELIISGTGEMDGTVFNSGSMVMDGGTSGTINNTGGTLDSDGDVTINGVIDNEGTVNINTGTVIVGSVNNDGTMLIANDVGGTGRAVVEATIVRNRTGGEMTVQGRVVSELTNDGDLTIDGGRIGQLTNRGVGVANVVNGGRVDLQLFNDNEFNLNSGTLEVISRNTVNGPDGEMSIAEATIVESELTNRGNLDVLGTVDGTVTNEATMLLSGTVTGDLFSSSSLDMRGNVDGTLTNTSNAFFRNGANAGDFVNRGGSRATVDGTVTVGTLTNEATAILDLADGTADDILSVVGDAELNGVLEIDIDFASNTADKVVATGAVTGDVQLRFDFQNTDAITGAGSGISVIEATSTSGAALSFSIEGETGSTFDVGGLFSYEAVATPGGSLTLEARVSDTTQGITAVAGLTQSLVGTVINRPTSPYVSGFDPFGGEQCGQGVWVRAIGGEADADGTFSEGGSSSIVPVDLSYRGFQAGSDYACFDAVNGGWDLAFGAIAGLNDGSLTGGIVGAVTETDFTQKYAGLYMVASKGRFLADLQVRREQTDFDVTGGRLDEVSSYGSDANTLSGSVAYAFPIRTGLQASTNLGFSVTDTSFDVIDVVATDGNGSITLRDHTSKVGFAGVTLSNLRENRDGNSAIAFFANATYYRDFSDPITGTVSTSGGTRNFEVDTLGNYGELSLGLNYTRLLDDGQLGRGRQLDAGVRIDARKGSNLDSWGITGQIRIQF